MSVFGWCAGPDGSLGNHESCPYEIGTEAAIVRCGCPCHETNLEAS